MAVKLLRVSQRWNGLSSDIKPTDAPEGSTFHIIDTGEVYLFHDGMWEIDLRVEVFPKP